MAGEGADRPDWPPAAIERAPCDTAVLIIDGDGAEAAALHFPDYAVIASPGGPKALRNADWTFLAGRDVRIWPRAADASRKSALIVEQQVAAAGAQSVAVVQIPKFLPQGWGLGDPWPPRFDLANAKVLLSGAMPRPIGFCRSDGLDDAAKPIGRPVLSEGDWPWGFRMEADGLWYDQPTQNGGVAPTRLSAPFEVVAEARDVDGGGWAVVITFKDRDGREKTIPVSRARLASGGAEVRAELADAGLIVSPARNRADKFSIALAEVGTRRRMTLVSATGWTGSRYVLPGDVIGPEGGDQVLFTGEARELRYGRRGSLEAWKDGVAAKADGNRLLTFTLSMAFLGPLLRPLDLEGGGFHLRGDSSCGKTTLAVAAGSVWGGGDGPLGFAQTWRATGNAIEGIARGHNDCLLVLDELNLVAPEEAGAIAYIIASGQSKGRSRTDGSLRRRSEWRDLLLSTGEISLAAHIQTGRRGERAMAGQELRLLDVKADGGSQMGVWETLHGAPGPAELSDALQQACRRNYGHAGAAFVERLVAGKSDAVATAKTWLRQFLDDASEAGDTGQAQRAAARFGAVAAAGELAAEFGVVPWRPGQAFDCALWLYGRWAQAFGRTAPREERQVIRQIVAAIESRRAAFQPIGRQAHGDGEDDGSDGDRVGEARSLETLGYRMVSGLDVVFCFHGAGWTQVTRGFDRIEAARVVDRAGYLVRDADGRRLQKSIKVKGEQHKLYCVKASILGADLGD
jgi:putative DNA primase/helicase